MDRALVQHLFVVRKKLQADTLREAINSHCNSGFSAILMQAIPTGAVAGVEEVSQTPLVPISVKPFSVEADLLLGLTTLVLLIDLKELERAKAVADHLLARTKHITSGFDLTLSKIFFYAFRVYELGHQLALIRPLLLAAYRSACVHKAPLKQAALVNLILRSFYLQGHVDLASKFASKITFPETRSNSEFARFLFYMGLIKAVQLEYSESLSFLTQAVRKAPHTAVGFRICATKAAVVVELLTGGIPLRSLFNEFPQPLAGYLAITQAVRKGDVGEFSALLAQNEALFLKDRLLSLVRRLHQNVIKAGLKSITASYSRISLADVAQKLSLASLEEAADVAAKAIVDGVIEANIDYSKGVLQSFWGSDVYSTKEPAKQLDKRVAFCLQLHTDAVRAMQYPDVNELEKELMATNEEILRAQKIDIENLEHDEEDGDMMM